MRAATLPTERRRQSAPRGDMLERHRLVEAAEVDKPLDHLAATAEPESPPGTRDRHDPEIEVRAHSAG